MMTRRPEFDALYEVGFALHKVSGLAVTHATPREEESFYIAGARDSSILSYRDDYRTLMVRRLATLEPDGMLFHTDNLGLDYLGVRSLPAFPDSLLILGPFLSHPPTDRQLDQLVEKNRIPLKDRYYLGEYFKTVLILDSTKYQSLARIAFNLLQGTWTLPALTYTESQPLDHQFARSVELEEAYTNIDLRYKVQNQLLQYVAEGDAKKAKALQDKLTMDFTHRVPGDPIRANKNMLIIFNTMLRMGAERAGVPPVQLHRISDNIAVFIERIQDLNELRAMTNRLIDEYCTLVNRHATRGLSRPIQKAVCYIDANLDKKLNLLDISEAAGINDSHLSRQFKKETGKTVTEYINDKKIDLAKNYLTLENHSITDISILCGFENHNYFSKVFKEKTGLTPRSYQKQHKA